MNTNAIKLSKLIWSLTPFLPVRKLYLALFMKLVRGKKVTRTVEGMNFELDLSENIDVCLLLEQFERDVVRAIEDRCKSGFRVLDIGANVGAHTLRIARKVGHRGVVYAFEPTSYAFDKLKRNISLNSTYPIHAVRLALSNCNESNRQINFRSSWQTDGTSISGSSTVDFIRLDDWCERQSVKHVDMIKIDVDGNEFPVFDGGRNLLGSCRPLIIMEVGAWHFGDPGTNVLILLSDLGYRFLDAKTLIEYSMDQIQRVLESFDTATCESINVIAINSTGK